MGISLEIDNRHKTHTVWFYTQDGSSPRAQQQQQQQQQGGRALSNTQCTHTRS